MVYSRIQAAVERHRRVAELLGDDEDAKTINAYADDLERLTKIEVADPPPRSDLPSLEARVLSDALKSAFRVHPRLDFEDLLEVLDHCDPV